MPEYAELHSSAHTVNEEAHGHIFQPDPNAWPRFMFAFAESIRRLRVTIARSSPRRNNVRIIKEKIADYIDPPRFYPLIGPAQLHHAHYKCTVYFEEQVIVGYPVPHTMKDREAIEVIYIDHNHFHMVGDVEPYDLPNL